jgi:indolepyruvate ferredoxin oxidoreductase alpha subunit
MVRMVEHGFALSEASNMPAMMELRIRACHVRGSFEARTTSRRAFSRRALIDEPAGFDYMRLAHPPVTFRHEKLKVEQRIPAAQALHRRTPAERASTATARNCRHRRAGRAVQRR